MLYTMNTFIDSKFEQNIINKICIQPGSSILLAVSGGQDSLCLLKFFLTIQSKYQLNLGIINIDHQWRNDTADNTRHIVNYMKNTSLPIHIYQIKPKLYSELESRNLRYQIFLEVAHKYSYSMIATAHTSSDIIETCIYNLTRGSSLDGLNSLVWRRQINPTMYLVRPLLNFQRWEIAWTCRYFSLPIWSDISNLSYDKTRNRIRQELIPYLKYHLQHQTENNILNFLDYTSIDAEYIRQNTLKVYQYAKHQSFVALECQILLSQHLSLQIRVLHLFFLHNMHMRLPYKLLKKILYSIKNQITINLLYYHITIRNNQRWLYCSLI